MKVTCSFKARGEYLILLLHQVLFITRTAIIAMPRVSSLILVKMFNGTTLDLSARFLLRYNLIYIHLTIWISYEAIFIKFKRKRLLFSLHELRSISSYTSLSFGSAERRSVIEKYPFRRSWVLVFLIIRRNRRNQLIRFALAKRPWQLLFRAEILEGSPPRGYRTWSCYCFEHKGVVTPAQE